MKRMLYKGVTIKETKVTRFTVHSPDGRKIKAFTSAAAAKTWVNGYLAALARTQPE